ncbi:MbnP family protein [Meiothermus rufus]|uniref:MbnP family protein n=1 Tax=Meiothermus rufus TaxID=604332 RepID=UPI00040F5632|nr:MbnP family protein [Meiothermus rufus]
MQRWLLLWPLFALALAAPVELKLNLRVGGQPLQFGQTYQTPQKQRYQIDLLKFYLSEVALVRPDGSEVRVPGLVLAEFKPGGPTQGVTLMRFEAPPGTYRGIRFNVGVPRELNHLDAATQSPPLGVNSGMYWAWNPGYIFFKLEGRAFLEPERRWVIHMGTDAFRIPVRLQDLQTPRLVLNLPGRGGSILLNLDVGAAFLPGPGGAFLDWRQEELRQLHGLSPQTRAFMGLVYQNLIQAFSLASPPLQSR